jgi:DnaJ-class molecular chaperone
MEVEVMAKTMEDCSHCKGKKMCNRSGGRSCESCLRAAGRGARDWGTVRCSVCGGRGKIIVDTEEQPAPEAEPKDETAEA